MPPQNKELQFINQNPQSSEDHRRNTYLAHKHRARVIRQRQNSATNQQHVPPGTQSCGVLASQTSNVASLEISLAKDTETGSDQPIQPERPIEEESWRTPDNTDLLQYQSSTSMPCNQINHQHVTQYFATSPGRTLCPTLGALVDSTLHLASPKLVLQTFDTQTNLVWPGYSQPFDQVRRLEMVCRHPIVLHGHIVSSAVFRSIIRNDLSLSTSREIILHRSLLMTEFYNFLTDLQDSQVPMALMLLLLVTMSNLDFDQPSQNSTILFRPHFPQANWINVSGRMLIDEAQVRQGHRLLVVLVQRLGGIDRISLAGSGVQVVHADLTGASRLVTEPDFPAIWQYDCSTLEARRSFLECAAADGSSSREFYKGISTSLPPESLRTYAMLSVVDRLMSIRYQQRISDDEYESLMRARYTVHHEVLSLPRWDTLPDIQKARTTRVVYELSRLTAVLYSIAIIWAMPPHTGWHLIVLERIQALITSSDISAELPDISDLLVWSSLISCIAGYFTPYRQFFMRVLREMLEFKNIVTWEELIEVVSAFQWSNEACGQGSAVVWDALGFQ